MDKAHLTATSPEDQGHVETEIPEALPLSHSLEFFLFKERGGRARFASSCPGFYYNVHKRENKIQQNAQSTSGKQKNDSLKKEEGSCPVPNSAFFSSAFRESDDERTKAR